MKSATRKRLLSFICVLPLVTAGMLVGAQAALAASADVVISCPSSYVAYLENVSHVKAAQTFTPQQSGTLSSVVVTLMSRGGTTTDLQVTITNAQQVPLATATVAQTQVPVGGSGEAVTINFSPGATLIANQQYSIAFVNTGTGTYYIGGSSSSCYSGGGEYWDNGGGWTPEPGTDLFLTTYMSSPNTATTTGPTPVPDKMQAVARPSTGCATLVSDASVNWSGIAGTGWNPSWAQWANNGLGGDVCVRMLGYNLSTNKWFAR